MIRVRILKNMPGYREGEIAYPSLREKIGHVLEPWFFDADLIYNLEVLEQDGWIQRIT